MPTKETGEARHSPPDVAKAILIELEAVMLQGQTLYYESLRGALKPAGVDVTLGRFSRLCIGRSLPRAVSLLLRDAGKEDDAEVAIKAAQERLRKALLSESIKLSSSAGALIKNAKRRGSAIGLVSALAQADVDTVVNRLGLAGQVLAHGEVPRDGVFPFKDIWLSTAAELEVRPVDCCAVVANRVGLGSAMGAHVRCVVVPDALSGFQDFGGADLVLEALDAGAIIELVMGD